MAAYRYSTLGSVAPGRARLPGRRALGGCVMPRAVDLAHAGPHAARIAVVDDDPLFLRVFAANLQSAGYQVACFGDPKQALASLLRDVPPDACVLDWNMPGLDGLALFKLLRARGVSVPVVFL